MTLLACYTFVTSQLSDFFIFSDQHKMRGGNIGTGFPKKNYNVRSKLQASINIFPPFMAFFKLKNCKAARSSICVAVSVFCPQIFYLSIALISTFIGDFANSVA